MVVKLDRKQSELNTEEFERRFILICNLMFDYVPEEMQDEAWRAVNLGEADFEQPTCVRNLIELINLAERDPPRAT